MINLIDKIQFYINEHGINGSHVSGVMLIDELHHPDLMKGRAVLHTAEKRIDFHSAETGAVAGSIDLTQYDDSEIQTALAQVTATANAADALSKEADALSKANQTELATVKTTANAAKDLATSNQAQITNLNQTTGEHSSAIAANTKSSADNATAITTKAEQSALDALTTTVSNKAEQSSLDSLSGTVSTNATAISQNTAKIGAVEGQIDGIETEVETTKQIAEKASTDVANLSSTVSQNTTQISANTKTIGDNSTAIASKAEQSALDAVSAVATAADTLSKANAASKAEQSNLDSLSGAVGQNTAAIGENTKKIGEVESKASANESAISANQSDLDSLSDTVSEHTSTLTKQAGDIQSNTSAIATKASQTDLDAVAGQAGAADARSQSNEAKLANKINTDSDASLKSLIVKNKITMGDGAGYITGIADAASALDAMNKRSVENITNALSGRIDQIAAGTGDESDYILVHGLDGLITYDDPILKTRLEELDGDTQCHIAFNEIRNSRPVANRSEVRWIMREYVHDNHVIWNFCPKAGIQSKDGILVIQHTKDEGCVVTITTESTILVKQMRYNFGSGNNGRRHDWQQWSPRIKGHEGFNKGQVLTDADITWQTSSNIRTNMQRLRDAIPNGCCFIGWHNHQSNDNKYRMIAKGTSSSIEGTTGAYMLWKHGGASSTAGLYINSASTAAEGWAREYIGSANAWVSFGKQENRSTATRFEGVSQLEVPFYEDPPKLTLFWIGSAEDDLLQTKAVQGGTEFPSVGRYSIKWDGTWTQSESMHTAFYDQGSNTYIAYDQLSYTWLKFTPSKQHTAIGQQAVGQLQTKLNSRSQFPKTDDVYVDFGDLDTLSYKQIAEPQVVHDTVNKASSIEFGALRWGYAEGGGVPSDDGGYPEDGIDPVEGEGE
jgi:hypothetical protein